MPVAIERVQKYMKQKPDLKVYTIYLVCRYYFHRSEIRCVLSVRFGISMYFSYVVPRRPSSSVVHTL